MLSVNTIIQNEYDYYMEKDQEDANMCCVVLSESHDVSVEILRRTLSKYPNIQTIGIAGNKIIGCNGESPFIKEQLNIIEPIAISEFSLTKFGKQSRRERRANERKNKKSK